jgi:hypothetical protein
VNAGQCCHGGHSMTFARQCRKITGWLVPAAILVVLPKCPACLAVYIAVGTGIGVSVAAATYVRAVLAVLCLVSVLYLVRKRIRASAD